MSKPTHRSFTLRVPNELYLELASAAQEDKVALNQKANQLLRLGMGKHISLTETLRAMLMERMAGEGAPA